MRASQRPLAGSIPIPARRKKATPLRGQALDFVLRFVQTAGAAAGAAGADAFGKTS